MNTPPLQDRIAIITGAARGIGRGIALELARQGAIPVINYVTSGEAARELAAEIAAAGGRAELCAADAAAPEGIQTLMSFVKEKFGGLDIFIANAIDVASSGPVLRARGDAWEATVNKNVTALLLAAQKAAPLMQGRPGKILAISSLGSSLTIPNYGAVGVTKAATEALVRYLAVELGPKGINVNALSAGPIDTDALKLYPNYAQMKQSAETTTPARRLGVPADLAPVAAFLCSDAAQWIHGQTLVADGGLSLLTVR